MTQQYWNQELREENKQKYKTAPYDPRFPNTNQGISVCYCHLYMPFAFLEIFIFKQHNTLMFITHVQAKRCWVNYIDYWKCVNAKGGDESASVCQEFQFAMQEICPGVWVCLESLVLKYSHALNNTPCSCSDRVVG